LSVFPYDGNPNYLDVKGTPEEVAKRAKAAFLALPQEVECCVYGSRVLVLAPENGSLEDRARHVTHFKNKRTGIWHHDIDKCRMVPSITATLEGAAAVIDDPFEGTVIFAKRYVGCGLHFVVVRPSKRGIGSFQKGELSGSVVTQFCHEPGGRQEVFRLVWRRKK